LQIERLWPAATELDRSPRNRLLRSRSIRKVAL
jgi:hypothetical protein